MSLVDFVIQLDAITLLGRMSKMLYGSTIAMKVRCFLEVRKINFSFLRKNYLFRLGMAHRCTVVESAGVIKFYLKGLLGVYSFYCIFILSLKLNSLTQGFSNFFALRPSKNILNFLRPQIAANYHKPMVKGQCCQTLATLKRP